jgi:hypothetical protein
MAIRQMALTPSLVAQIHRVVEDPGPDPNVVYHTEEDYDALVRHLLLSHRPDQDLWLFAYGSLIWKPEVDHIEERIGTAHGWHRAFRLRVTRWRASADQPGLIMGLDRGGQCRGALFRITAPSVEENLGKLVRREMSAKPPTNYTRQPWLGLTMAASILRARGVTNHLLPLAAGFKKSKFRPQGREGILEKLQGFCQVLEEAVEIANKDLERLVLAQQLMGRVADKCRSNSKLPELVDLFLSRPLVTVPLGAKLLKVTPKAVDLMLVQLGGALPRELTGRRRYRAWGIV